jgi:hypothetical protein
MNGLAEASGVAAASSLSHAGDARVIFRESGTPCESGTLPPHQCHLFFTVSKQSTEGHKHRLDNRAKGTVFVGKEWAFCTDFSMVLFCPQSQ